MPAHNPPVQSEPLATGAWIIALLFAFLAGFATWPLFWLAMSEPIL